MSMTKSKTAKVTIIMATLLLATVAIAGQTSANSAAAMTGGPVVLMGIDAEDGSPFAFHGPMIVYETVAGNILSQVTNGGSGVLVFGCGKSATDDVTFFWNSTAMANGQTLTCVNGAADIASESLAGYAMIGVASSVFETFSGGLTDAENDALALRQVDIANHVNNGGGLWGLSQVGLTNEYGYIGGLGSFSTTTGVAYDNITPTVDGLALGIDDSLDVFAWHDVYDSFPTFLNVLATVDCSLGTCSDTSLQGKVAAIGGQQVIITGEGCTPGYWKNNSDKHDAAGWTIYNATDSFDATFSVDIEINWSEKGKPKVTDDFDLQQALEAKGGDLNALARHGTAALLNAAQSDVGYDFTEAEVIQMVQDAVTAYNVDDLDTFNSILEDLVESNETVCPINQQGIRV